MTKRWLQLKNPQQNPKNEKTLQNSGKYEKSLLKTALHKKIINKNIPHFTE